MNSDESKDLEKFLSKVDQISELVNGLNSNDETCREKAAEEADALIASIEKDKECKTKFNRTVINTNNTPKNLQCESSQDPETFMRILDQDAEERSQRRKRNEAKANALREKGNEAFKQGDYEMAVKFYTEGLEQRRDIETLYTNRAQTFIKLERYEEAVTDCEWALKCNEKSTKAHVLMGRSHLALKNFSQARICFHKISEIEPQREAMTKDFLTEVDLEEKADVQEKKALESLQKGSEQAKAVSELLEKLKSPSEISLFYSGGIELLILVIKGSSEQTLFRLNDGFGVINGNSTVRRCLSNTSEDPDEVSLCQVVLRLWKTVCSGNEKNQQMLLQCPHARKSLVELLDSPAHEIQGQSLELLSMFSQTRHGRGLLVENLNMQQTAQNLMSCVCRDSNSALALTVLENLATENKFKIETRQNFNMAFVLPFENLLSDIVPANVETLSSLINVVRTMALDDVISKNLASREEFWTCSLRAMERCVACECTGVLYPLLGLMINLASNPSQVIQDHAVLASSRCLGLLSDPSGGIITRAAGVLSVLLSKSATATQEAVQNGVVKKLLKILKCGGEMSSRYSIKALAVCTASIPQARKELVKLDTKLHTLRKLLGGTDELVIGNAALCLGHCLEVDGAARGLLGTDCVLQLLRHAAGDCRRTTVQQNAAITLGRLCKKEPRHMARLRELHGLEILHSCLKLIT